LASESKWVSQSPAISSCRKTLKKLEDFEAKKEQYFKKHVYMLARTNLKTGFLENFRLATGGLCMFRRREQIRERLLEIIQKFRERGAVSPDKAMTAQELGLPPRFEEAMKKRLGKTGIFIEVNGRYYLSEERLKEAKEKHRLQN
jgi:hypothetical protein